MDIALQAGGEKGRLPRTENSQGLCQPLDLGGGLPEERTTALFGSMNCFWRPTRLAGVKDREDSLGLPQLRIHLTLHRLPSPLGFRHTSMSDKAGPLISHVSFIAASAEQLT